MNIKNLYIHIPFCTQKCLYCHFYSFVPKEDILPIYFKTLKQELLFYKKHLDLKTIYIGGGTPCFNKKFLIDLLIFLKNNFSLTNLLETTIELNPLNIDCLDKLSVLKQTFHLRLSIGIQSFNEKELKILGRNHTIYDNEKILKKVSKNFTNFSIDLMYGFFSQTVQSFEKSLKAAMSYNPSHLSVYELEPDVFSKFYKNPKLESKTIFLMYKNIQNFTNLRFYELSNLGEPCIHNLDFWTFNDYLGVGAGAFGKFNNIVYKNKDINEYIKNFNKKIYEKTDPTLTKLMLLLRLKKGIDLDKHKDIYTFLKPKQKVINKLLKQSLVKKTQNSISLTYPKGFFYYDYVLEVLLK